MLSSDPRSYFKSPDIFVNLNLWFDSVIPHQEGTINLFSYYAKYLILLVDYLGLLL